MKFILILLITFNLSFAKELFDVEILETDSTISFKNIKTNKNFKRVSIPIIIQHDPKDYWLKINFNKKSIEDKTYILTISSLFNLNEIEFDKNLNLSFLKKDSIEFNKNIPQTLYCKVKNNSNLIYISAKLLEKGEFLENKELKDKLYGLAYGIVFTAFLYYLLFFIYNKKRVNLYYSMTQLFSLLILIFSQDTTYFKYDFISLGFIIFSILFTKEFLQTKKHTPKINTFFNFIIALNIFDMFFSLEGIFPIVVFLLLYPISAIIIYKKTKKKPILFYILAWGIVIFTFIFITVEIFIYNIFGVFINFMDILHVILPLESIVLAFALSYSMKVSEDEKNEKEKLLIHQNKLASIGEMINNIAHQWRQPLTHLNYVFMNLNMAYEHNKLNKEYLKDKTNEATNQLTYMSKTIDIFKDFYTPHITKEDLSLKDEINNALQIVSSTFEKEKIKVSIKGDDFKAFGPKGELSQVIMNILTNAKDAFIENRIKEPHIKIILENKQIKILDNAGGINNDAKVKMFTAYFSTKKYGSGIGLYMSKLIVEKHFNGKLSHKNKDEGSLFLIELN